MLLVSSGITPANVELATKLNRQIDKKYFTVISILVIKKTLWWRLTMKKPPEKYYKPAKFLADFKKVNLITLYKFIWNLLAVLMIMI